MGLFRYLFHKKFEKASIVIWFVSFKKLEVSVLPLCKENRSTNSAIVICQSVVELSQKLNLSGVSYWIYYSCFTN